MKKYLSILLTIAMVALMLNGCQTNAKKPEGSDKLKVVATIFPQYDFVREIAGEQADLTMLLLPGAESHSYEPTPQDIIKIQNCDVFIYVGGESDAWVDEILGAIDISNKKIVTLMDCVDVVEEELKEGMEEVHEHEEEEHEAEAVEFDEHVWTSPQNAIRIVNKIKDVLCEIDSDNAESYKAKTDNYVQRLNQLDAEFKEVVQTASRRTMVFGDKFPLRYFADAYNLDYWAAFPGCSNETEASAGTIAFLINKIKEESIPVVFKIELSNGNMAASISEATNAKVMTFYSCHNLSKDDFQKGETYLSLMKKNVQTLKEALS